MKKNYYKTLILAAMTVGALSASATYHELSIPDTQEEFSKKWFEIKSADASSWEWVEDSPSYAQVHPEYPYTTTSRGDGQGLFCKTKIEMTKGDVYNLLASVTTSDYNDDNAFRFAYTTDGTTYTTIGTTDVTVWNSNGATGPMFQTKPTTAVQFTVPEDGTYYFGIVSRGGKNNTTTGYFKLASISYELKVDYPAKVSSLTVTPSGTAELSATVSWKWPSKSDAGADLTTVSARVYRSTSYSFDASSATLVADVTGGVPGETASVVDSEVPEAGKYYYHVQAYLGDGVNPSTTYTESKWIGEDVKCLNIVASTASLTMLGNGFQIDFEKRVQGYNSGWIDPEQAFIKIYRQKNSEEKVLLTDSYQGDSPYIDPEVEGPGSYTYYLYVTYKGVDSAECKVGPTFGGGAETVPFTEDFSESSALDDFTILTNYSYYKWTRNYAGYAVFYSSSYSSCKSSMLTPPISLEAGKTYKIACTSWVEESDDDDDYGYDYSYSSYTEPMPQDLTFTAGKVATFDGQTAIETIRINQGESSKMSPEVYFSPAESGNYYIGFQVESSDGYKIYLDDIAITESVMLPADVADFTVVPDAAGEKQATVSFTVPATSNGGLALSEVSSVTVSRLAEGDEEPVVVKLLENEECAPGSAVSFVDEVPVENNYTYSVVVALGDKLSNKVSSEAMWIGYDYPKNISSFSVSLNETSDGEAKVTWSALSGTIAKHGGYIDTENLKYRVYRIAGGAEDGPQVFVGETKEAYYVDSAMKTLPWNRYRYAVSAINGTMESDIILSNNVRTMGDAIELPYEPNMADETEMDLWDSRGFLVDGGAFACYNKEELEGYNFYATTPPFYTTEVENPAVSLEMTLARGSNDYEEALGVYTIAVGGDEDVENLVTTVSINAEAGEPQEEVINIALPSAGKYRIKLKAVSEYNKRLEIRAVKLQNAAADGVRLVTVGAARYDARTGNVIFGENVRNARVYAANGTLVAAAENVDALSIADVQHGIYLLRATTASGELITLKLVK